MPIIFTRPQFGKPQSRLKFTVILFVSFILSAVSVYAQPSNDDPCNAIPLPVTQLCTFQTYTNANATASAGVPAPGCASYSGGDVWFTAIVPCTGTLTIDSQTGVITDGGMAIYSGTCNSLTLIECDDDDSPNGAMPRISRTGLTPGATIYIRFWEFGNNSNGTFGICASLPIPPPSNTVCNNALPFCSSNIYTFPNATNIPNSSGGGIYGCLSTIPNPVWYYMQIQNSGTLTMQISQVSTSGTGIDVDFVLWGPFTNLPGSCGLLSASNIVDCSYSPDPIETATIPNAVAGEYYIIMITNFNGSPGTITFQQTGGTGSSNCSLVCNLTPFNSGPVCPGQPFNLNVNTVSNATYTWTGPNCFNSTQQNPTGVIAPSTPGTYTYTITVNTPDGVGCVATTTVTVGSISATATPQNASCPGTLDGQITVSPNPAAGTYTYTLMPGNITQTNPVFTGLGTGTYSVSVTNASGCSSTINNITIAAGNAATATHTFTNGSCPGVNNGSITVTPNGPGPYSFTLNPGNITNTTGTFTGLAAGTYSVNFTLGSGCGGTVNGIVIGSGPAPTGTSTFTNTTCPGVNNGTITVTPGGGAGPYSYTLNPGNITQANPTFTGLAAGTYNITFTNGAGCTGTVPPVTISNGPVPNGSATSTNTNCPGVNDGTITVTPSGAGPYTFTLNPGNITQASPTFTNLAPGSYTVSFTNGAGCTGTVSPTSITVNAGPALTGTATSTATSCPTRNDGTITVSPGGTGPYTFTLNPGAVTQSSPTFTGLAAGTYTVSFVTASGCNGVVPVNPVVTQGPFLSSTTTLTNPPCANINDGSIRINASGVAPFTYTLNPGNITQANSTFSNLAPGTYSYNFTDANGCTGSGTATLTTNSPLAISVAITMPLCNGNANGIVTLTGSGGVPAYQYARSPFATFQPSGTFTGLAAGTYTFRLRDNVGCTKDTTITIAEPTVLTATAANTVPSTCNGNDGTIVITAAGGTPAYEYSIDNGAYWQSSNTFIAPAPGAYPNIRVRDAKGCIANANTTVTLIDTMHLSFGPAETICVGKGITLNPITNPQTNIFQWSSPNAPLSTLSSTSIKNPVATPTDTSVYTLTATWGACTRTASIQINTLHIPIAHAGEDTAICFMTTATLRGSVTENSGPVLFSWSPDANVAAASQATTTVAPPTAGIHNYTLTVSDDYGCNFYTTDVVRVVVQPPVPARAGNDTIAASGLPHQLSGSGGVDYVWSPAAPLNNSTAPNPIAILTADTKFTLIVTDVAGCIGYDTVFVKVYNGPTYYVPNAFSPNGDGLNDIFRAVPSGIRQTEWFRVFNRYGELIFQTNEWLKGWDGSFRGKKQPVGVYVWVIKGIDMNGKKVEMKGTVMLVQ